MPRLGLPGVNPALGLSDHWQVTRGAIASGLARSPSSRTIRQWWDRNPTSWCLAGQWAFSRAVAPFLVMGLGALMWALDLASPAHAADDQIDSFAIS